MEIMTELAHFSVGIYVIKATLEGTTAHGSGTSAEEAEDKARSRVLLFSGRQQDRGQLNQQLLELAKKIGLSNEKMTELIKSRYEINKSKDLSVEQLKDLVWHLEAML